MTPMLPGRPRNNKEVIIPNKELKERPVGYSDHESSTGIFTFDESPRVNDSVDTSPNEEGVTDESQEGATEESSNHGGQESTDDSTNFCAVNRLPTDSYDKSTDDSCVNQFNRHSKHLSDDSPEGAAGESFAESSVRKTDESDTSDDALQTDLLLPRFDKTSQESDQSSHDSNSLSNQVQSDLENGYNQDQLPLNGVQQSDDQSKQQTHDSETEDNDSSSSAQLIEEINKNDVKNSKEDDYE